MRKQETAEILDEAGFEYIAIKPLYCEHCGLDLVIQWEKVNEHFHFSPFDEATGFQQYLIATYCPKHNWFLDTFFNSNHECTFTGGIYTPDQIKPLKIGDKKPVIQLNLQYFYDSRKINLDNRKAESKRPGAVGK